MRQAGVAAALVVTAWTGFSRAQAGSDVAEGSWAIEPVVDARLRGEYRHEVGHESGILLERARLGVDAIGGALEARAVVQSAAALGAGSDLTGPARFNSTGPYELWGEWCPPADWTCVRVGRQPITWGEGRLLGSDDWSAKGHVLDAVRWRMRSRRAEFELLGAVLTDSYDATVEPYGGLFGARADAALDERLAVEATALARLAVNSPIPSGAGTARGQTYTLGLRAHGHAGPLRWSVEADHQSGHAEEIGKDRDAWAAASHFAYAFDGSVMRPTVRLAAAYASGDGTGSTYTRFDPLLPDEHRWHGAMDLFAWSNEAEASVGASILPWATAEVRAEYRYVRLAQASAAWLAEDLTAIGAAPQNTHADLGHEVDLAVSAMIAEHLEVSLGYSLLVLGAGARAIITANQLGRPEVSHFAFLQAVVRFP